MLLESKQSECIAAEYLRASQDEQSLYALPKELDYRQTSDKIHLTRGLDISKDSEQEAGGTGESKATNPIEEERKEQ